MRLRTCLCPRRSDRWSRRAPSPRSAPRAARRGRASLRSLSRPPSDALRAQLGPVVPLRRVGVLVKVVDVGIRTVIGEVDDVADLRVDLLPDRLEVLLVRETALLELVLEGDDRI